MHWTLRPTSRFVHVILASMTVMPSMSTVWSLSYSSSKGLSFDLYFCKFLWRQRQSLQRFFLKSYQMKKTVLNFDHAWFHVGLPHTSNRPLHDLHGLCFWPLCAAYWKFLWLFQSQPLTFQSGLLQHVRPRLWPELVVSTTHLPMLLLPVLCFAFFSLRSSNFPCPLLTKAPPCSWSGSRSISLNGIRRVRLREGSTKIPPSTSLKGPLIECRRGIRGDIKENCRGKILGSSRTSWELSSEELTSRGIGRARALDEEAAI